MRRQIFVVCAAAAVSAGLAGPAATATHCVRADGNGVCVTYDSWAGPQLDPGVSVATVEAGGYVNVTCGGPSLDCLAAIESVTLTPTIRRTGADLDDPAVSSVPVTVVHVPDVCVDSTCTGAHDVPVAVPVVEPEGTVYVLGREVDV